MSDLAAPSVSGDRPARPEYRREVALVAKAIRESGDEEALALFGAGREPDPDPTFDHDALVRVAEVAERAGAGWHAALDLYTAVVNPGWAPFGDRRSTRGRGVTAAELGRYRLG